MKIKNIQIQIWKDAFAGDYFATIRWTQKSKTIGQDQMRQISKEITRIAFPEVKLVKYLSALNNPWGVLQREVITRYKVHNAHKQMHGKVQIAKEIKMMELKR